MSELTYHGDIQGRNVVAGIHGEVIHNNFYGPNHEREPAQARRREPCAAIPFPPDPGFIHRPDILNWVHEKCSVPGGRAALVGLGGVGKSQIVIYYAHETRRKSPNTWVFWVHAGSRIRFESDYRKIADTLCLPSRNDPQIDVLKLVYDWLCQQPSEKWLMVLDNCDDMDILMSKEDNKEPLISLLPTSTNGSILITSRNRNAAEKIVGNYRSIWDVDGMSDDIALQVFRQKLARMEQNDEEEALKLINALSNMPLMIAQAAALINQRKGRMSISDYLHEFLASKEKRVHLLRRDAANPWRELEGQNSIAYTCGMTFVQIKRDRESAAELLLFISFFQPHAIPESALVFFVCENGGDKDRFEDDLNLLLAYSMVTVSPERGVLDMHPLVSDCMQDLISSTGELRARRNKFIGIMSHSYPWPEYENWHQCEKYNPHVELLLREPPNMEDKEQAINWASLGTRTAKYWVERGKYDDAERLLQHAFNVFERLDILESEDAINNMLGLSWILLRQGERIKGEAIIRRVIKASREMFGEEHRLTGRALSHLAIFLSNQGKYDESESILREVIKARERLFGKEHSVTLHTVHNLAVLMDRQQSFAEAEKTFREVLVIREKVLGKDHPYTLLTVRSLAKLCQRAGRVEEASVFFGWAVSGYPKVYGPEHPWTMGLMKRYEAFKLDTEQRAQCKRESSHLSRIIYGMLSSQTGGRDARGKGRVREHNQLKTRLGR